MNYSQLKPHRPCLHVSSAIEEPASVQCSMSSAGLPELQAQPSSIRQQNELSKNRLLVQPDAGEAVGH